MKAHLLFFVFFFLCLLLLLLLLLFLLPFLSPPAPTSLPVAEKSQKHTHTGAPQAAQVFLFAGLATRMDPAKESWFLELATQLVGEVADWLARQPDVRPFFFFLSLPPLLFVLQHHPCSLTGD